MAFGGDVKFFEEEAAHYRKERIRGPVMLESKMPTARALVRGGFTHERKEFMKAYGVVNTGGCGNLLLCRKKPGDSYNVVRVCIEDAILTGK